MPQQTIEQHHCGLSDLGLATRHSRIYITQALQWERVGVEITTDLLICQCAREYLRQTGKHIDRLDRSDYAAIAQLYLQLTGQFYSQVSRRLAEIGAMIRTYTSAVGKARRIN